MIALVAVVLMRQIGEGQGIGGDVPTASRSSPNSTKEVESVGRLTISIQLDELELGFGGVSLPFFQPLGVEGGNL